MTIKPEIALILRDDEMIREWNLRRTTLESSWGPLHHCYYGKVYDVEVLLLYGRFNGQKIPSAQINYQQYIQAIVSTGVRKLIGTFVVGGIKPERPAGTTYILGDMVGMGPYAYHSDQKFPFHNAEMFHPFCPILTASLKDAAASMDFPVVMDAVYVCFHGWPRIETAAELSFYNKMGWDIVGQTCDPEATMARLAGLCYAGIAVQIDDPLHRKEDTGTAGKNSENSGTIKTYRQKVFAVVRRFLKDYKKTECGICGAATRKNNSFREFPAFYYEE